MDAPTPFSGRKLAQVAIVVNDIKTSLSRWADLLGVPEPDVIETEPGSKVNMLFKGAPSDARAKLAFFDLGGVQLELIEPIGDDSAWAEGLRRNGESVHHLAFWVDPMTTARSFLESRDAPLIHRGDMGDGQYAYHDAQAQYGVMLELLEQERSG